MGKLITIIVLMAVSTATFMMYVAPTYDHINAVKAKIARLDQALSKTRDIRRIRQSLSTRFSEFSESNLEKLQKMLPDHVDNVRLVLDIDGIASQYGMRLKNVAIQDNKKSSQDSSSSSDAIIGAGRVKQEGGHQSLVLQFEVEATYAEFVKFLSDIESSLRLVDLVEMSVASSSGSEEKLADPKYTFTLALKTHWLK